MAALRRRGREDIEYLCSVQTKQHLRNTQQQKSIEERRVRLRRTPGRW